MDLHRLRTVIPGSQPLICVVPSVTTATFIDCLFVDQFVFVRQTMVNVGTSIDGVDLGLLDPPVKPLLSVLFEFFAMASFVSPHSTQKFASKTHMASNGTENRGIVNIDRSVFLQLMLNREQPNFA